MIAPLPGRQRAIAASPAHEQRVIDNEMALFQAAQRGN